MKKEIEDEKRFKQDKNSLYNIIVKLNSMDQLINEGWTIMKTKNDSKETLEKSVAIVSVLGNKNSGKSFLLHLLTNKDIPNGYTVTTEGLSFIIPDNDKNKNDNFILIDTAGTESPLLSEEPKEEKEEKKNKKEKKEKEESKEENKEEKLEEKKEEQIIEDMVKDRQITDYFIQKFILEKSDIFICVVGNMTLTDQKFINRIIKHYANKKIYIIHNLKTFVEKYQVEEYITDTLLKSLTFDLEKEKYYDLANPKKTDEQNQYFYKQKLKENDRIIIHLIIANNDSDAGKYYNKFAIDYLNKQLRQVKEKKPFDIVKNLREFLVTISGDIFKSKLDPNLITKEQDIIKIKSEKLDLKDCSIDELGNNILTETIFKPKYRYGFYTDHEKKENKLIIEIELFGIWKIMQQISTKDNHFIIGVSGKKEKEIEERKYVFKNYNPGNKFDLEIKVGNEKGFLGDNPVLTEENGLYILTYTLRANNKEEEVVSGESDEDADV